MELKIYIDELEYMQEDSCYNNKYYKMPLEINGCNIIYGESDDDNTTEFVLGKFIDGKFKKDCWLGYFSDYNQTYIYI